MNSKKKLIVALSTLCCVLVAAVVTVVVVLAATTQTLTSNIKVTYTTDQVAGTVKATYATEGNVQTGELHAEYEFTGADTDFAPEVTKEIVLNADERFVVFTYEFTNAGDMDYTAAVDYTDNNDSSLGFAADENVKMVISTTELADYAAIKAASTSADGVDVPANTSTPVKCYIYVAIVDVAQDAEFSGTFAWTLA